MLTMEQLHILVVDDNRINRLYLKTILTQWQHHVTEVDSGLSALSACRQQPFDLILMDIRMQPMDGVTAAYKIKALKEHSLTPIVAVSAEQIACAGYPQFIRCLTKPLSKHELKQLIDDCLDDHQTTESSDIPFDEEQALAISHQDADIVLKLRTLFVDELPKEMDKIEQLHQSGQWQELADRLHHLQGSARVCAAVYLCQCLQDYRQQLTKPDTTLLDGYLQKLKQAAAAIMAGSHQNAS